MMSEASFASLSPTLLARKGGAKPAMRPQLAATLAMNDPAAAAKLEDLGWNDMGEEDELHLRDQGGEVVHLVPRPDTDETDSDAEQPDTGTASLLADPHQPTVRKQQVDLARRIDVPCEDEASSPQPRRSRARKSALDRGNRAAFTLRLDQKRHLKLRLACTVKGRSAQQLVTDALDALLAQMPEIDTLAAQVRLD